MAGTAHKKRLIEALEQETSFCGRYRDLAVQNCDPVTGDHLPGGGNFSVVFRAFDEVTNSQVAIKFFDPDQMGFDLRRYELFERECVLLDRVQSSERCLKLICPMQEISLASKHDDPSARITIPCRFFVTEWIDEPLDSYFLDDESHPAIEKLKIFREIVLAVNAIHQNSVYHRDLKADNLRIAQRDDLKCVVAIDYGTAAVLDIARAGTIQDYIAGPVGMGAYSPLEAHCGLALYRTLAPNGDIFSLGAILYELFAKELHFVRQSNDIGFSNCYLVCKAHMLSVLQKSTNKSDVLRQWHWILGKTKRQVSYPEIDPKEHEVPRLMIEPMNQIIRGLSHVDYRERWKNLEYIIRRIDAILSLNANEERAQRLLELKRRRRIRRLAKMRKQQAPTSTG